MKQGFQICVEFSINTRFSTNALKFTTANDKNAQYLVKPTFIECFNKNVFKKKRFVISMGNSSLFGLWAELKCTNVPVTHA